ncbi:DUF3313 domain-containing protein [Marinobacter alexandrii]|uniref:DUF3313 domain-containing protein n=1 Tax=Marinobacter alexandrii TaxID=2570351 RepID=UPI00329A67A5
MKKLFAIGLVGSMMLGSLQALAAQEIKTKDFSGWMEDYDSLVFNEDTNSFVFFNEDARGKYDKVILESVSVYSLDAKADPVLASKATDYLTIGVRKLLKEQGILAQEPGPKVLRYSMALTGVEKSKEDLKAHNLIPVSAIFRGAKAATGNLNTYIEAMFEAKLVDSVTGERVAATVRKGIGETEKKSGDEMTFDDVKPTLDMWLAAYAETLKGFLASN